MMEEEELCFPQLLNASCKKPKPPHSVAVFIYILLFFISVLTAALNLLVIISISHYRQLHSPTNLILLSLAVSDFFVGFLLIPFTIFTTASCWVLGDLMCALYFLLPYTFINASGFNMVLVSVDRYVAICDPMHYSTRITDKVVRISVCLCWIFAFFYGIFILFDHLKQPGRYNSCYGECVVDVVGEVDLVAFISCTTVVIVLYIRVFVAAVSQARAMRSHVTTVTVQYSMTLTMKSELKAARTLGVVVVAFLICYSPYYLLTLTGGNILVGSPIEAFMSFLMYFNSCLNPVIYAFFYPWFRKAVKHIVTLQILQPGSSETNIL